MDGNPVGPTGGKALLKMIASEGNMREISLEKCNFEVSSTAHTLYMAI